MQIQNYCKMDNLNAEAKKVLESAKPLYHEKDATHFLNN
jgi:hypothetical protein